MLSEQTIFEISQKRSEPKWLLDWRLAAYHAWKKMTEPHWAEIDYAPIDYDSLSYYKEPASPFAKATGDKPIDNSDLKKIYEKMKLPESEQRALLGMATDTVIDSRSVHTSYTAELEKLGIIFLPFSEAVEKHPDMIKKYLGTVVSNTDNFFAALNAAVFSDGTFVYIPAGVKCPIELASYFRIETAHIGQFERTLIVAEAGSELSYLEGCSAPRRPNHQLHSGVVEIIAMPGSNVKYSTVQNWYAGVPPSLRGGAPEGGGGELEKTLTNSSPHRATRGAPLNRHRGTGNIGGIYNFVTKRGRVDAGARLLWTQVEVGSALTWKYPSSVLAGDGAHSDFYSLSITRGRQMADTGTKMIHVGNNTTSNIVSYGVAMEESRQTFRSLVSFGSQTRGAKNASKCDSKLIGDRAVVNTYPTIFIGNGDNDQSHEARTGAVPAAALYYLATAGIAADEATALIVSGIAAPVLARLPMEFLVESKQLIQMALSSPNAVGGG